MDSEPAFTAQYVEKPTDALAEEAVKIFSALMLEDPSVIAFTGGDVSLTPDLGRSMIRPLVLLTGDMYTATDPDGNLVGFTLWVPPGRLLFDTDEQRQFGFYDFLAKLNDEAKVYYLGVLGREFPRVVDELTGIPNVRQTSYWCNLAFVKAEYQGKGIAKALFQLAFEKAKKNGDRMALSTTNSRNVPIYQKLGFELKGYKEMPSPWGSWPAYAFVREADAN